MVANKALAGGVVKTRIVSALIDYLATLFACVTWKTGTLKGWFTVGSKYCMASALIDSARARRTWVYRYLAKLACIGLRAYTCAISACTLVTEGFRTWIKSSLAGGTGES